MKITNYFLLKTIFSLKGNFKKGHFPEERLFNGINVSPFKHDCGAAVCISADLELNWAWRELSEEKRNIRGANERKNLPYILNLFEKYEIPITWATVGHLFLKSCNRGKNNLAHPEMARPPLNERWKGDWFLHDPCTNLHLDPFWYAPDLIYQIINSKVPHEIGTHSFSHIDFSPEFSNSELIRSEIEECKKAMKPFGLKPRSLVFPFNKMGYSYLELLSKLGIIAVRSRDKKIRLSYPERTESGVYKIYESMNLRSPRFYDYLDKAKIFIEEAVRRQAVYHIWFHPSDPSQVFENEFRRILEHIHREREKGLLWVATMGDITSYCEARDKIKLQVYRKGNEIKIKMDSSLNYEKYGYPEISLVLPANSLPKMALLKFEKGGQEIKHNKFFLKQNSKELVVSVPINATALHLKFLDEQ